MDQIIKYKIKEINRLKKRVEHQKAIRRAKK